MDDGLNDTQRCLIDGWLGEWRVLADRSWGLTDTVVLEVASAQGHMIVKASGPDDGHLGREIRAHRRWTRPWVASGHAARLVASDTDAGVLVTTYLPGHLVQGTPAQDDPDTYRQAGRLMAAFHSQHHTIDPTWNDRLLARVERFLDGPHRISAELVERVREEIASWSRGAATVVPTHGDWAPRNWLDDAGVVRAIDFGRCDLRVPEEDFVRLARQDFARDGSLENAYIEGYGQDPREAGMWRRVNVAEAVGTAAWAHQVNDTAFEATGLAHLARLYGG